jgi:WD40 repeat protein
VFITGRDHSAELWDVEERRAVTKSNFDIWARGAKVSPGGRRALLLYDGVSLVSLPEMQVITSTQRGYWSGVVRCAAFAPDDKAIIAGKTNGELVVLNRHSDGGLYGQRQWLYKHSGQVQAVEVLRSRRVVVSAGSEGTVQFISWENKARIGYVRVPGARLTSLQISPDGDFMAVGDTDASLSFWDLRIMDIPVLFSLPFAKAVPNHLAAVSAAAAAEGLRKKVRLALLFMQAVLRHRFRFDIEIDEVQTIRVGEYDIEIEG